MIYQAGDREIIFDSGDNNPGDFLQKKGPQGWKNFKVNGEVVKAPVDFYKLPPGQYRLVGPVAK
jgi:hypothetical protein